MPMNAQLMATAIESHMGALAEADAQSARRASLVAICQGIIEHFVAAATINGTAAVGLTTAPGGGPVTGVVILPPGSIT